MTQPAVLVDGVSKRFRISTTPTHSLKERLVRVVRRDAGGYEEFDALRGVDATISTGQTVGILGHNGSGKSTLLKCIAGIITPSAGSVQVAGRLTSLLELGAGFHPDLTGRENVYINAAFYGMGRRQIDAVFDAIVDFSELARFIDEPVKHYSSGMYVRLGFAVAVNLDPDVLLVDEVLAVGDELFQVKCLGRIKQFQDEGRTIVFVTHDADTVRRVCDRAVVLHHGALVHDGEPAEAIRVFREHLHRPADQSAAPGHAIAAVRVLHEHRAERRHVRPGEEITIEIDLAPDEPVEQALLDIEIGDRLRRPIFHVTTDALDHPLGRLAEPRTLRMRIGNLCLLDGEYPVSLKLVDQAAGTVVDWRDTAATIEIEAGSRADGAVALDVQIL